MTIEECIAKIEDVAREYLTDKYRSEYMDKIIDIIEEYNRGKITQ